MRITRSGRSYGEARASVTFARLRLMTFARLRPEAILPVGVESTLTSMSYRRSPQDAAC